MEKKYYFTSTKEEVKMGKTYNFYSNNKLISLNISNQCVLDTLVKLGCVEVKEESTEKRAIKDRSDIFYYIENIANKRFKGYMDDAISFLNVLYKINKAAHIKVILKEIAVDMDKAYPNHISESDELYSISAKDGCVHPVNKKDIISYDSFACFRSKTDALIAMIIMKDYITDLLYKVEKKNVGK